MHSKRRATSLLKIAVVVGLLTGSAWFGASKAQGRIQSWMRPVRYPLESTPPRITGREAIIMPAGTCVVFQIPPIVPLSNNQSLDEQTSWLPETLSAGSGSRNEIYREPKGSYWYNDLRDVDQCVPTFNCVTYALGDSAGLTMGDYVPTSAGDGTQGVNPTRVILDSYYLQRESWDPALRAWGDFENDPGFAEGEIICFVDEGRQDFIHMMRVSKVEGKNRLVGKLGAGPVVRTSAATIALMYQGKFDLVEVYRRK